LATPSHERGDVRTEAQWAEAHGYKDPRTMRMWKNKPAFLEMQKSVLGKMVKDPDVDVESLDLGSVDFTDERDYRLVKTQLLSQAKSGNLKAAELYMKLFGKSFIEDEAAARSTDFATHDLERLVATAAAALSPELLAGALEASGWTVLAPGAAG
jgi:hypothetical protein